MMKNMAPTDIRLLQKKRELHLCYEDGSQRVLTCAYLRAHSPAADAKSESDPSIFANVNIVNIEPVGNYAVKFVFDDGHDSGIYSWETLYKLGMAQQEKAQ